MQNPLPSFDLFDLVVGLAGAAIIFGVVAAKKKNAKKYRKNVEYGSARWGQPEDIATPLSVDELIARKGLNAGRVAVEVNGAIVPRDKRAQTMLSGTDTVEIVTFVQGG